MKNTVYFGPQLDSYPGFLSKKQIKIHFEGHHLGYVRAAEKKLGKLKRENFHNYLQQNKSNNTPLANNLRQIFLHNKFWENLLKDLSELSENQNFFEKINEQTAFWKDMMKLYIFGSGWVIAYAYQGELKVGFFRNAQIPDGEIVFVIDLWEHSFYLDYQNRRNEYLEGCKKYLDWKLIHSRLIGLKLLS